ncbi:cupin domain-containing protein [Desulfonatronum parangueonense]
MFLAGEDNQLVFMQFAKDAELPEHAHAAQVGFVLAGMIELTISGATRQYGKGGIYHIPVWIFDV